VFGLHYIFLINSNNIRMYG